MIGRSRSAYCGPYSSMTMPRSSTRYSSPFDAADADRLPLGHRPLRPSTAATAAAPRRATHGDASSRCAPHVEVGPARRFSPRRPFSTASTSPFDSRSLPRTTIRSICSTRACARADRAAAVDARPERQRTTTAQPSRRRQPAPVPRRRDGLTCARRNRRSAGAATGAHACASGASARCRQRLDQPIRNAADRSGAERDHDIARPRDAHDRRHHVVERRHHVDRRRGAAREPLRRAHRASRPAIGSSPAA